MSYRVLVVDDYEPWRRHICSVLETSPSFQVIGEASDGGDAVDSAQALRPDLILLDVGLPTLNGIRAAERILAGEPRSRILFVTEQRSWDIAEAALGTGAQGYLCKSDAGTELLPAMDAVVGGRQFISASIARSARPMTTVQPAATRHRRHDAGFYADEHALLEAFAQFGSEVLSAGGALIALPIVERQRKARQMLEEWGVDIGRVIREGRYIELDATAELEKLLVDGRIDDARFWRDAPALIMAAVRASTSQPPRVAAWGELAPQLWRQGRAEAAITLEHLWEQLAEACDLDILCAYTLPLPGHADDGHVFEQICAVHSAVRMRQH